MTKDEAQIIVEQHKEDCPLEVCDEECQDAVDSMIWGEDAKRESLI